jgi:hypothetical protein
MCRVSPPYEYEDELETLEIVFIPEEILLSIGLLISERALESGEDNF